MKKYNIILSLAAILLASCTTTHIASSWREPGKQVDMEHLKKVLVVALFRNESSRQKAEDEMAGYLKGKGVVAYKYLGSNYNNSNVEALREKLKADGFDGAITMRLVDVDREHTYVPGNMQTYPEYYKTFSLYYGRNWTFYNTPGYYLNTKTFTVETNVYSLKEDKVIWIGVTKSTNPDGVPKMTKEITKVLYKKMLKEGFISEQ